MKDYSNLTREEFLALNIEDLRTLPIDELTAIALSALNLLPQEKADKILREVQLG